MDNLIITGYCYPTSLEVALEAYFKQLVRSASYKLVSV